MVTIDKQFEIKTWPDIRQKKGKRNRNRKEDKEEKMYRGYEIRNWNRSSFTKNSVQLLSYNLKAFLVACYTPLCPSVCRSVGRSVGPHFTFLFVLLF